MDLRDAIATLFEDRLDRALAGSIFGTAEPRLIASRVEAFVREHLDARVVACPLFTQSVGAVVGLELDDGRRVALKAHAIGDGSMRGFRSIDELDAVYRAQDALAAHLPCAPVIVPPRAWKGGAAAVMTWLDAPRGDDPHDRPCARALARFMARAAALATAIDPAITAALPRARLPAGSLFPQPHNVLFDLDDQAPAWIVGRASAVRGLLDAEPAREIVMHTDVSAANVRVSDGEVVASFDLDSLAWIDEMRCLGSAAVHFSYRGDPPWTWPSRDEARAFVADYVVARGRPLDDLERARLDAAAIHAMAYTAACEADLGGADWMQSALRAAPDRYLGE